MVCGSSVIVVCCGLLCNGYCVCRVLRLVRCLLVIVGLLSVVVDSCFVVFAIGVVR